MSFPTPPFAASQYPMTPVTASTGAEWAVNVLDNNAWKLNESVQGRFDASDGGVDSIEEFHGLETVMAAGPTTACDCVSYVCVTGPGAQEVDVAVYPPTSAGATKYLGWKGDHFAEGPAININGAFWYRLKVQWESPDDNPNLDPNSVLYAKTYRHQSADEAQSFKLWAFKHNLAVRRNLAKLEPADRNNFRDALFLLKERGGYDKYIKFHGFTSNLGHSGPAFFAWHRVFLHNFEQELRQTDPRFANVTLPYWDYTSPNVDDQNQSKIWRPEFLGTNGDVNLNWTGEDGAAKTWQLPGYEAVDGPVVARDGIRRRNFDLKSLPVNPSSFNQALRSTTYTEFEPAFESGPHGGAHVFLGTNRDQGRFATAVNDPFFMLLHCNVDRMWVKWQELMKERWLANNPGTEYPPTQPIIDYFWDKSDATHTAPNPMTAPSAAANRHNLDDVMWPWDGTETHNGGPNSRFVLPQNVESYTPRQVLSTESLGYVYDMLDPTGFSP
jgi:hypothetical protein